MGDTSYLIPGFLQDDTEGATPVAPPAFQKDDTGPGFWGTLGQILANLKVGVYRGRPGSSNITGLSYNDLIAPVREAKERRQLFDTYLGLGKQAGIDTTPFEKMSFGFMGPSPSILKTMGGFLQHSMQYGHRKPLGPTVAEAMFPGKITTTTPPTGGLPSIYQQTDTTGAPAPWEPPADIHDVLGGGRAWEPAPVTPGTTTISARTLSPMEKFYKEFVTRATPAELAQALPTILQYAPGLLGSQGWQSPEKRALIDQYKAAYPDASKDIWGQFESYPPYAFTGLQRIKTVAEMRRVLHEDRGERRLQGQEERYQKKLTDEPLERARTTAHATRNSLTGYLTPEQLIQWGTQIDQAQTPEEVARIQQAMGKQVPPEKPFTPQQERQHVQQLTRGIVDNVRSLTALSGYLKGALTHDQAGQVLNLPTGGTLVIPPAFYSPTRPNVKPAPTEAQVKRYFEMALATVGSEIAELERLPQYRGLAAQYRATLNGIAQDMAGAQTSTGAPAGPPTVPGAAAPTAAQNPLKSAMQDVLTQRNLREVPGDPAQLKDVLDAVYHQMIVLNYSPTGAWVKDLQRNAKAKGLTWTPPATP